MPSKTRWILILVASGVADFIIRIATDFSYAKIMLGEAILFSLAAIIFALLIRLDRNKIAWTRWSRITLVWFFALGGFGFQGFLWSWPTL
jgi:hypothetical protein